MPSVLSVGADHTSQPLKVEIVTPKKEPEPMLSPTNQKVMKVAAVILFIVGIALIAGSAACFGAGAVAGASAIFFSSAQGMVTLGVISLIAGAQMMHSADKGKAAKTSFNVGGLKIDF